MNMALQYVIVFAAVIGAGWYAWRSLRGRRVLGRGRREDSCAGCPAAEHPSAGKSAGQKPAAPSKG